MYDPAKNKVALHIDIHYKYRTGATKGQLKRKRKLEKENDMSQ